jgi:hypothetical protein
MTHFTWKRRKQYRLEPLEFLGELAAGYDAQIATLEAEHRAYEAKHPLRIYDDSVESALKAKRDAALKFLTDYRQGEEDGKWSEDHMPWDHLILVPGGAWTDYSTDDNIAEAIIAYHRQLNQQGEPWRGAGKIAGAAPVADIALHFAQSCGPLRATDLNPNDPFYDWQPLRDWYRIIADLQHWLRNEQWRADPPPAAGLDFNDYPMITQTYLEDQVVGTMNVILRHRATGRRPEITMVPSDLFSLIGVQFAELATGGVELSNCAECGKPFFHGGSSRRKAGALYCDEVCREKAKTKRRGETRRAAKVKPKRKRGR